MSRYGAWCATKRDALPNSRRLSVAARSTKPASTSVRRRSAREVALATPPAAAPCARVAQHVRHRGEPNHACHVHALVAGAGQEEQRRLLDHLSGVGRRAARADGRVAHARVPQRGRSAGPGALVAHGCIARIHSDHIVDERVACRPELALRSGG